jgi:heme oxygenase
MSVTTPPRSATTAAHRPLTEFATPADLAGAAYVVEGALMGAKLLERALPPETATADSRRFWTWSAAAGPRRWAMTRGFIETACPSSCEREAAIKTAIAVFGLFRDIVSKDLAELPH